MAFRVSVYFLSLASLFKLIFAIDRLTEIQVILAELVRKFQFTLPDDIIIKKSLALTVIPATSDGVHGLPLQIEVLE